VRDDEPVDDGAVAHQRLQRDRAAADGGVSGERQQDDRDQRREPPDKAALSARLGGRHGRFIHQRGQSRPV
jgi:hypothetical protein